MSLDLTGIRLTSQQCDCWEAMYKRLGPLGIAAKMVKTPGYRAYVQKWPFDNTKPILGEEDYLTLEHKGVDIVNEVDVRMRYQEYRSLLSPRQQQIWDLYEQGKTPAEIMEHLGYNTTNAIRWHKHQMKKIWSSLNEEEPV